MNQHYSDPRRLEIWWSSVFINSNRNTACNITNLVALALVVVDPGCYNLREENNMPIRIEKILIISYPSLSQTDFRRMSLPSPIPVKRKWYSDHLAASDSSVFFFLKHTEIHIPDSKEKAVKKWILQCVMEIPCYKETMPYLGMLLYLVLIVLNFFLQKSLPCYLL